MRNYFLIFNPAYLPKDMKEQKLYGRLGLELCREGTDAKLLVAPGLETIEPLEYCRRYSRRSWYPSDHHDLENMRNEISVIKAFRSGRYGFKKQLEYSEEQWEEKLNRLLQFVNEAEHEEDLFNQYSWLHEAAKHYGEVAEMEAKKEFFSGPVIKTKAILGQQINLFET